MSVRYNEDFKKEVIREYMAGNKSIVEFATEYNVARRSFHNGSKIWRIMPIH